MFRSVVVVLAAAVITGCAALNMRRAVTDEDLTKTRRVGVVSVLGDMFHGVSIGTTVFNNTYFSAPVSEWSIDKSAVGTVVALLRGNTRFESAEVDHGTLSAEQVRVDSGKGLWDAAERQGFDRLVILRPGVSDNYPSFRPSFGLFERSMFGSSRRCIYAAYVVDVYDVATRKPIAWEWGGGMPCLMGSDTIPFKAKFEDYSIDEKQLMRQRLEARISESLRYALGNLSLLPAAASK